ncbi:Kdo hydroxylase family protein [Acidicapsa dinghuensis]|uniref:Kdo hydroxylase family protein n=1 Tax=Acidicapsa dinghuensis TaxID=2218256 RepID=A0ABW1EMV4_9BACT|nr:Kdo hydroxylase family protein [Acidicapsa dinghuensis]
MSVHAISLEDLNRALRDTSSRSVTGLETIRTWCTQLEAGGILYFPQTPVPIPTEDLEILLSGHQTGSALHKNIAYKPGVDKLSGVDDKTTPAAELEKLHAVMRRYSASIVAFLSEFLAPYQKRWQLDYASYRPIEEDGRDLPVRRRNDLLHTDSFPTRPTYGRRILRFFHNIHPSKTRDWVTGEPFAKVVSEFVPGKLAAPQPDNAAASAGKKLAQATGLAGLVPQWKRGPYDDFMMRLHNTMKEDAEFQKNCVKEYFNFPPGSSWMVYTETTPHAVLAGQFALEQTFLVDQHAMVTPESAPIAVLEKIAGAQLT